MINLKGAVISTQIDGELRQIGHVVNYFQGPSPRDGAIVYATTGTIEFMMPGATRWFLVDPDYARRILTLRRQLRLKGRPGWKRLKTGRGTWAMPLENTVIITESYHSTYRFRRVRIAPCPNRGDAMYHHETCVMGSCSDDEVCVACTCGWTGPSAATEEQAVRLHNSRAGMGFIPITPWIVHRSRRKRPFVVDDDDDLPF